MIRKRLITLKELFVASLAITLLLGLLLTTLSITTFERNSIQSKETDPDFLKTVISTLSEVQRGKIDPRTAACMISDLHESSMKTISDELEQKKAEEAKVWVDLNDLKKVFETYRNTLGETDLYRTTSMPVTIIKIRPEDWQNKSSDHIASVSKDLSHWLNKWAYIPGFGIVLCCETNDSETNSMVILDSNGTSDSTPTTLGVVLLGQRVIKEAEIKSIQEMWNSVDNNK